MWHLLLLFVCLGAMEGVIIGMLAKSSRSNIGFFAGLICSLTWDLVAERVTDDLTLHQLYWATAFVACIVAFVITMLTGGGR